MPHISASYGFPCPPERVYSPRAQASPHRPAVACIYKISLKMILPSYFLSSFIEAGISLVGTEIKSLKINGATLNDSYVIIRNQEAYLLNMHISEFKEGNIFNHDPLRTIKLLLHKKEIIKLSQKIKEQGYTLVCTKVYLKNGTGIVKY